MTTTAATPRQIAARAIASTVVTRAWEILRAGQLHASRTGIKTNNICFGDALRQAWAEAQGREPKGMVASEYKMAAILGRAARSPFAPADPAAQFAGMSLREIMANIDPHAARKSYAGRRR